MTLNRRQLFRLVGAGAALSSLGTTAAVAAQPKFVEPLKNPCSCALTKTRWA